MRKYVNEVFVNFQRDDLIILSAAFVHFALLSLVPITMLSVGIAGWMLTHVPATRGLLDEQMALVEEVFGPALPIWRVSGLDEAIERANASQFGLGSSIWTRDLTRATVAAEKLEAGYTWVNSPQIVYDELPFGGFGESGLGKEHGNEALDHYQESKSVVVRQSPR